MGDEVHLRQVFYNLIDNACKYAKDHPEITIKIKQQNTKCLIVEIADNGIGIKRKISNISLIDFIEYLQEIFIILKAMDWVSAMCKQ